MVGVENIPFEYRVFKVLDWLDIVLKDNLDYVFMVLVYVCIALLIWRVMRRRRPIRPRLPQIPFVGVIYVMRFPKPSHTKHEEPPPPIGSNDHSQWRDDDH